MRRKLLAATALCTSLIFLTQGVAMAQQAAENWSGPYIGMLASGIGSKSHLDVTPLNGSSTFSDENLPIFYDLSNSGFGAGITAGYNFQNGSVVYGIEGDASGLGLTSTVTGTGDDSTSYTVTDRLDSLLTLRGRLGVVEGKALIYGTAGVAAGQASFTAAIGDSGGSSDYHIATGSGVVAGGVAGVGIEYALTDKLSLKAEGKVYQLASLSGMGDTGKGSPTDPYTAAYHPQGAMFSTGLNFHF
jgi:outer membrane immunogenic protein